MHIKNLFSRLNEKDIIVYKNALSAFIIKGLALILSLFTMPAYIRFFENQSVLGVWYTILSVLTWILSFDFGIGNGLRNKLAASLTTGEIEISRSYISSAYFVVGGLSLFSLVVGCLVIPLCNWNEIFNISATLISPATLSSSMRYVFIGIMLQFFLRLIASVAYAMQKSALNNVTSLLTSLLLLMFAFWAPNGTSEQNLKMFSIAYIFCSNIPLLALTFYIFLKPLRKCTPHFRYVKKENALTIASLGGIFFLCQILYMLISNTNEFFVTQYTSPENVVDYQIYYKLFSLGSMLFMLALSPVWSVVSKAIAEKDFQWLRTLYHRIKLLSWIGVLCEFILIVPLQWIINFWLKDAAIQVNYFFAITFALFGAAMLYQSALSTIVGGMGKMKLQALCYGVGIVLKFLIIHFGTQLTDSWIVITLSNALILIPYCIIQQISLDRYFKKCN